MRAACRDEKRDRFTVPIAIAHSRYAKKENSVIRLRTVLTASLAGVILCLGIAAITARTMHEPVDPAERTVELIYRVSIQDVPGPRGAGNVSVWIPMPLTRSWQTLQGYAVKGDKTHRILTEPEYGNRFLHIVWRRSEDTTGEGVTLAVHFTVTRKAYRALPRAANTEALSQESLARFLSPDRMVPIGGKIAKEAKRVAGDVEEPLERAKRIYHHIVESVVYDKSGQGWGRGDALYVCDKRGGNCTDFHSLFIGETRALGVPARFVMGLPLPPGKDSGAIEGYHCWAEFYLDGRGWIPVDASEASKKRELEEALFGGLDAHRVAFTIGRDIHIPQASAGPINFVIYPHVEIDGNPHTELRTSLFFREVAPTDREG